MILNTPPKYKIQFTPSLPTFYIFYTLITNYILHNGHIAKVLSPSINFNAPISNVNVTLNPEPEGMLIRRREQKQKLESNSKSMTAVVLRNDNRGEKESFCQFERWTLEDRVLCVVWRERNFDIYKFSFSTRALIAIDRSTNNLLAFHTYIHISEERGRRRAVISETLFRVLASSILARKFPLIRSRTLGCFILLVSCFNSLCDPRLCIPVSEEEKKKTSSQALLFSL